MPTYAVNFATMQTVASEMQMNARQILQMNEELEHGSMQALVEWESPAKDLFDQRRREWIALANEMSRKADQAQALLGEMNGSYASAQNFGVQLWDR